VYRADTDEIWGSSVCPIPLSGSSNKLHCEMLVSLLRVKILVSLLGMQYPWSCKQGFLHRSCPLTSRDAYIVPMSDLRLRDILIPKLIHGYICR
jgi:hypothetical protein